MYLRQRVAGRRHPYFFLLFALILIAYPAFAAEPPAVTLAETYAGQVDLSEYWVSEKYDGVRGYWDGERLITRGGTVVNAPDWFTAGWPDTALDGELWLARGRFADASGIVRTDQPSDAEWRQMLYMVFDLPEHGGAFDARVPAIRAVVAAIDQPWVRAVEQYRMASAEELQQQLGAVVEGGGEGLMLHRGGALYAQGRSADLLKLKPYADAEARVVGYNAGNGRLEGMMGSVEVVTPDGRRFAIGTGFSDAQRADPPPIGAWVTYRHNGETSTDLPRFARFLRMRPGGPPPEIPTTGQ